MLLFIFEPKSENYFLKSVNKKIITLIMLCKSERIHEKVITLSMLNISERKSENYNLKYIVYIIA